MFDTVVIATDGSESVQRAIDVALDLADRFDASVHALSVIDSGDIEASPESVRSEFHTALIDRAESATDDIATRTDQSVKTVVKEGRPAPVIAEYAREAAADMVALGTRGHHGENRFLIGSVAERVVRTCPVPVLTVRQLSETA